MSEREQGLEVAGCIVSGCSRAAKRKGMCGSHHFRMKKYGDPHAGGTPKGAPMIFLQAAMRTLTDECIFWPFAKGASGAHVYVDGKNRQAARIACEHRNGPPPSTGMDAAHSCGNGHLGCVNPEHLRWATRKENVADSFAHGTVTRGEKQGANVLTEREVWRIYKGDTREPNKVVAARFGVSKATVSDIRRGKSWSWLTGHPKYNSSSVR